MGLTKPPNELQNELIENFVKNSRQMLRVDYRLTQRGGDDPTGLFSREYNYSSGAKDLAEKLLINFFDMKEEELRHLEAVESAKLKEGNYEDE